MSRLWLKSKSTLVGSAKVITTQNPGKGLPEDPDDYALYRLTRVNFEDTCSEVDLLVMISARDDVWVWRVCRPTSRLCGTLGYSSKRLYDKARWVYVDI